MKVIIRIFIFSVLLLIGCTNRAKETMDIEETDVITLTSIEESRNDTCFLHTHKPIVLETMDADSKSSLIAYITKIATDDDFLFILDRKQMKILIFDTDGKFINQIHCIGQGPKEYVEIINFTVDPVEKQIIVLCSIPTKNMYFSYTGEFIRKENNAELYMGIVKENKYVYFERPSYPEIKEDSYQFTIKDTRDNSLKNDLLQVPIRNYAYNNGFALTKGKTNIQYARRFDNVIYQLNEGMIEKIYRIDFKQYNVPERLKKEEDSEKLLDYCRENNYIFSMTNVVNSNRFLLFYTDRATFVYDKSTDVLKGYKKIICSQSNQIRLGVYFPVENSNKIAYMIMPYHIDSAISYHKSGEKDDKLSEIAENLEKDNNPVLFIYELP
jgi:hypothetical protein